MQNDTFHFSNFFGGNAARLAAENDRLREQLLQATAENVQLGETLQQIQQIATAETGDQEADIAQEKEQAKWDAWHEQEQARWEAYDEREQAKWDAYDENQRQKYYGDDNE